MLSIRSKGTGEPFVGEQMNGANHLRSAQAKALAGSLAIPRSQIGRGSPLARYSRLPLLSSTCGIIGRPK